MTYSVFAAPEPEAARVSFEKNYAIRLKLFDFPQFS
jgi:hypothetical protein